MKDPRRPQTWPSCGWGAKDPEVTFISVNPLVCLAWSSVGWVRRSVGHHVVVASNVPDITGKLSHIRQVRDCLASNGSDVLDKA